MVEKILIVDDDPDTVKYLSIFLQRMGYEYIQAFTGIEALKIAHEQLPHLIILDVMMPGMDGYEVARSLRRHPDTALIPILMFTAKSQVEDKLTGYDSGVDIFLTKPVHPRELQANIKALLIQKKARVEAMENRGYIVGVMAPKGGLGVSTISLNLAFAYKKTQKLKVIAAEMRPGQGTWAEELGLSGTRGLVNLLKMNVPEITPAAVEHELTSNIYSLPLLLASNEGYFLDCMTDVAQFETVIEELSQMSDLLVLDIGTQFHPAMEIFSRLCDEIIIVTEPQPLSVKRTHFLVSELRKGDFGSSKAMTLVMVNRQRTDLTFTKSQIEEALGYSVTLGFTPVPELAFQAAVQATPLYHLQSEGLHVQQFNALATHIASHVKAGK